MVKMVKMVEMVKMVTLGLSKMVKRFYLMIQHFGIPGKIEPGKKIF